ncbi:MAG TPA: tetratricopeptide repeat protein [Thermoguttaceae bacterium]
MGKTPWAMYLWPGLPQLWRNGSWSALVVAIAAAAMLNVVMVGSFAWTELIDDDVRNPLWVSLGILWIAAALVSVVQLRRQTAKKEITSSDDPFSQAVEFYLKGDYYQVERLLHKLLGKNTRDLDARLLLATMLRHMGRIDEAEKQLDQLLLYEGSEKWELEIERERGLLVEAKKNLKDNPENGMALAAIIDSEEILHST